MRVVVTRPAAEAAQWVQMLRERGVDALAIPLIEIRPAPDVGAVASAWGTLAQRRAAMFVSGNAVRGFFGARPAGSAWPPGTRAWCTGPGTRQALLDAGVGASLVDAPSVDSVQFDSEALWSRVSGSVSPDDAVLIVRGADAQGEAAGRPWLAQRLQERGAQVNELAAYARGCPAWDSRAEVAAREALHTATWLFSSSEAVDNLRTLLPGESLADARAVATHPRIAQAATAAGFGVVRESRPAVDDVIATLESAG